MVSLCRWGDLNAIPPTATKTNFCYDYQCEEGEYDPNDEKKGACDFTEEINWLNDLYGNYEPAINLEQYSTNESNHYTYSPGEKLKLDRSLTIYGQIHIGQMENTSRRYNPI